MALETDDELLARALRDSSAFGAFYRRYERPMLRYFMQRVADAELAADLAAETFAAALQSLARYRPGDGSAAGWLFAIANHTLLKSWRRERVESRARRRLGLPPLVLDDDLLDEIERAAADERAAQLLATLPEAQAIAIRGRVVQDLDYDELARRLRCSEAVVRKRVSRGLAGLRRQLREAP
jgi:RNA polymerase sigma factor (sigma-70 family)